MSKELLAAMRQSIIDGDAERAEALAKQALEQGVDPLTAVNDGYVPGIHVVGDQFGAGTF